MPEAPAAPAAAPTTAATPPGSMSDSDAFSVLDSFTADAPPAAPAAAPAAPSTAQPPAKPDATPTNRSDDIPVKPAASEPPAKPATTSPTDNGKAPKTATLRDNYERLRKEHNELKAKHEALEKSAKPAGDAQKSYDTLKKQFDDLQAKLTANEQEMRFVQYERSPEYKEKYEQPFVDAYNQGRAKVASFKVTGEDGTTRQATPEDFDALVSIADDDAAAEKAQELFGNKASLALYHRERVQELNGARIKAIDDYRKQGSEREKARNEAATREQSEANDVFKSTVTAAKEKYKDLFSPAENDERGNQILDQGEALVDFAYGVLGKGELARLPKPLQEKIARGQIDRKEMARIHAAIRNKAAGFDRTVYRLRAAEKRVKELETQLSEFQRSEPGPGQGGGKPAPAKADDMESTVNTLDDIAKPAYVT